MHVVSQPRRPKTDAPGLSKAWVSWSSGKDSAFALHTLQSDPQVRVVGLLCTVNQAANRLPMHAVRRELAEAQASRLNLPIQFVELPDACTYDEYVTALRLGLEHAEGRGVTRLVFGDLFLEDVRDDRSRVLSGSGISPLFPLWKRPTTDVAADLLRAGIRAVVTCLDSRVIPPGLIGRRFDRAFLADLPPDVDPCGENGEFHTFVYDAPGFSTPLAIELGGVVRRGPFVFQDVRTAS